MNTKLTKLIKYYSLINHNLIFSNKSINRYKANKPVVGKEKTKELEELREKIKNIKNCDLKDYASNLVFSDGNPNAKVMIVGEDQGLMKIRRVFLLLEEQGNFWIKC